MSDYQRLDDEELKGGDFTKPRRAKGPLSTIQMKAKVSTHIDKAIEVMTAALNGDKAYNAAKDILAFYLQLSKLEMAEEVHEEDMKFKRLKQKEGVYKKDKQAAQEEADRIGSAVPPQSNYNTGFAGPRKS